MVQCYALYLVWHKFSTARVRRKFWLISEIISSLILCCIFTKSADSSAPLLAKRSTTPLSRHTHTERHREYSTINLLGEKLKTRSEKARNVIRLWNKQIYANIIFADLFKIAKWCWGRGWAQRRAMPEDSNRKKSASIQPRAIPAEFSTASNFWPNFASIILRTSSAGTQFRSFERTQSSAKWYAVRYEVEDGRRERRRWWWRWGGCLYT